MYQIKHWNYLLAIIGLCYACQPKTLSSVYKYQLENTPTYYELRLDTTHQQFTFIMKDSWGDMEVPGYFSTFRNNLHLIPLKGKFFKRNCSLEDSTYKLNIFYAENGAKVKIFSLRSADRRIDTLISKHQFEFEVKESNLDVSIWHIGHWPYLLKLQGSGCYDVFLYQSNYNPNILSWKIGRNGISSDELIMKIDKKP